MSSNFPHELEPCLARLGTTPEGKIYITNVNEFLW